MKLDFTLTKNLNGIFVSDWASVELSRGLLFKYNFSVFKTGLYGLLAEKARFGRGRASGGQIQGYCKTSSGKTSVSPMMGCWRFSDPRILGVVAASQQTFYCLWLPTYPMLEGGDLKAQIHSI